jgi:hypothetical protein
MHEDRTREPWFCEYEAALPQAATADDLTTGCELLHESLAAADVELVAMRARAVLPARFNALIREHGNKAAALSLTTLGLLADVLQLTSPGAVLAVCDKHGGRNKYQALLQTTFPDYLVEVRGEGAIESRYCWGPAASRVEVRFCVGGESFLPAALASMTAKYLRELSMQAFNEFWQCRVPDLRPTAGYPTDARRFKREIDAAQRELAIADDLLWRER